ncbi:MAG: metal-dependent transcriptional regulator [Acidobacteriota bacterium]
MHRKKPITETHEMYLKTVHRLGEDGARARVRDVALTLGVSPGTVSNALKKLEDRGLVRHERYGDVVLTEPGRTVAECVDWRYQTLKGILVEMFGLDEASAEADACEMEHAVSPKTIRHMNAALERYRKHGLNLMPRVVRRARPQCLLCEESGECQGETRSSESDDT